MASERELTERLRQFFTPAGTRGVRVPIGDDAAVVDNRAEQSVVCCDPVIGGVHFDDTAPMQLVGRKAVNRNLSDLAAMGARPDWLLVSLVLPRGLPAPARRNLLLGIRSAARSAGAVVVGGDVAVADGPLVVNVTAIGHLEARALRRDGARVGDCLHLSGPIGGSDLGLHLRFRPALQVGEWLAGTEVVTACMDVSDGLLLDLATMLRASASQRGRRHLGAELAAEQIPLRAAARAGGKAAATRLHRAMTLGEDHVLLFTVRRGCKLPAGGPLSQRARRPIGRIVAGDGVWLCSDGERRRLQIEGYQHPT